ncbi:hypothetical protein CP970_20065 [Streptomyces kanamyceticus]|uniref:Uncharacterized protein n=1 Tax=Streptomyces kanamyceticus TaxID=1967 RepID=A0A5J6GAV5_STRKN|nr:hypothetical protein CP970_20065 [Streptomyces kanamyceticus]
MDAATTLSVALAMIALGALVPHLLNDQHADRITSRQYSGRPPGRRGAHSGMQPQPITAAPHGGIGRRDHRDGGRGRLRPRRRITRATKGRRA